MLNEQMEGVCRLRLRFGWRGFRGVPANPTKCRHLPLIPALAGKTLVEATLHFCIQRAEPDLTPTCFTPRAAGVFVEKGPGDKAALFLPLGHIHDADIAGAELL